MFVIYWNFQVTEETEPTSKPIIKKNKFILPNWNLRDEKLSPELLVENNDDADRKYTVSL
jgi:hypothetical protein